MVPSTTAAVVVFLLLVVPGLAFELMRQRARPPRPDSAFIEIARVVFVGVSVSGLSLALLSGVAVVRPNALINIGRLIGTGIPYVATNVGVVLRSAVAQSVVSVLIAVILAVLLRPARAPDVTSASGWHILFNDIVPLDTRPFLSVGMRDGTVYTGFYHSYSAEAELGKRELVLAQPLKVRPPHHRSSHRVDHRYQFLWLPAVEITSIYVIYKRVERSNVPRWRRLQSLVRLPVDRPGMSAAIALAVVFGVLLIGT